MNMNKKGKLKKALFLIRSFLITSPFLPIVFSTSCSSSNKEDNNNLTLAQIFNKNYENVKISPSNEQKEIAALESNWPKSNIKLINGFPEETQNVKIEILNVKKYDLIKGQIEITIRYSKDGEHIDKDYLIEGFKWDFEVVIDQLYGLDIIPTEEGKKHVVSNLFWAKEENINSTNLINIPVAQEGIEIKIFNVFCDEFDNSVNLFYKFSKIGYNTTYRKYKIVGFDLPAAIDEEVKASYGKIEIIPTIKARELAATEANWPIEKINDQYFIGLPKSNDSILVEIHSISYEPNLGVIFLTYYYRRGDNKTERTYIIEGFSIPKAKIKNNII